MKTHLSTHSTSHSIDETLPPGPLDAPDVTAPDVTAPPFALALADLAVTLLEEVLGEHPGVPDAYLEEFPPCLLPVLTGELARAARAWLHLNVSSPLVRAEAFSLVTHGLVTAEAAATDYERQAMLRAAATLHLPAACRLMTRFPFFADEALQARRQEEAQLLEMFALEHGCFGPTVGAWVSEEVIESYCTIPEESPAAADAQGEEPGDATEEEVPEGEASATAEKASAAANMQAEAGDFSPEETELTRSAPTAHDVPGEYRADSPDPSQGEEASPAKPPVQDEALRLKLLNGIRWVRLHESLETPWMCELYLPRLMTRQTDACLYWTVGAPLTIGRVQSLVDVDVVISADDISHARHAADRRKQLTDRIRQPLKRGLKVACIANSSTREARHSLIQVARSIGARSVALFYDFDEQAIEERNALAEWVVSRRTVERVLEILEAPRAHEADEVWVMGPRGPIAHWIARPTLEGGFDEVLVTDTSVDAGEAEAALEEEPEPKSPPPPVVNPSTDYWTGQDLDALEGRQS